MTETPAFCASKQISLNHRKPPMSRRMGVRALSANVGVDEVASPAMEAHSDLLGTTTKKKEKRLRMFLQNLLQNIDLAKRQKVCV